MGELVLALRLGLAALFLATAVLKFSDQSGFRQSLSGFGFGPRLCTFIAPAIPTAEAFVGVGLLWQPAVWSAGVGALALSAAFAAVIAFNLSKGRRPPCHCFGQASAQPIGPRHLVMNAAMAVASGTIVVRGPSASVGSLIGWFAGTDLLVLVLVGIACSVVLFGGSIVWVLFQILAQQGRILLRLDALDAEAPVATPPTGTGPRQAEGLPVGSRAPQVILKTLTGEPQSLDPFFAARRPVALAFTDPHCASCNQLLPELGAWAAAQAGVLDVVVISRGADAANRAEASAHGFKNFLLQEAYEVAAAFEVRATPSMLLLTKEGAIGTPVAVGPQDIRALMRFVTANPPPAAADPGFRRAAKTPPRRRCGRPPAADQFAASGRRCLDLGVFPRGAGNPGFLESGLRILQCHAVGPSNVGPQGEEGRRRNGDRLRRVRRGKPVA